MNEQVVHFQDAEIVRANLPACGSSGERTTRDPYRVTCEICRRQAILAYARQRKRELAGTQNQAAP